MAVPQAERLDAQFSGAKGYLPEDGLHNKNVLLQETHKSQDWRTPHPHGRSVQVIYPGIGSLQVPGQIASHLHYDRFHDATEFVPNSRYWLKQNRGW